MTENIDVTLNNFFVFNSNYGQSEGEEEKKILYFYPHDTPLDNKMKEVGLSEAIIKFIRNFSNESCEALRTEKTRKLFLQPEDNFWVIMTVNIPVGTRGKDVLEGVEYLGSEVKTALYMAILKQAYLMASLFIGPFKAVVETQEDGIEILKKKLDVFYSKYLSNLYLNNCDVIDLFQGVRFLGLDKPTFLCAQCFINQVEATFPIIDYSLFLYDEKIIWSGLNPADVQALYRYIVNSLLPTFLKSKTITAVSWPSNNSPSADPRFVTGYNSITDLVFSDKTPKVYLSSVAEPGHYHLVVYRVKEATICFLIHSKKTLKIELYRSLDNFLYERMDKVQTEISTYLKSQKVNLESSEATDVHYVYFNSMNLATKTSYNEKKFGNSPPITKELLGLLIDLHQHHLDLQRQGRTSGETYVKSITDHWIAGQLSNNRQFYVAVERKKANFLEVSDEVKILCEKQLKSIFFHI